MFENIKSLTEVPAALLLAFKLLSVFMVWGEGTRSPDEGERCRCWLFGGIGFILCVRSRGDSLVII